MVSTGKSSTVRKCPEMLERFLWYSRSSESVSLTDVRVCSPRGMQRWGVDYWLSIRTLMTISEMNGLQSRSIDFVLAYPQADLDTEVCELPAGFDLDGNPSHYVMSWSSRRTFTGWNTPVSTGSIISLEGSRIEDSFHPWSTRACTTERKQLYSCRYMIVLWCPTTTKWSTPSSNHWKKVQRISTW